MSIAALTGQRLAGSYQLNALLAHGARSVVYDAQQAFSGARCAVKIFHREILSDEAISRLRRDSDMAAALHHPGIVRVHGWSRSEARPLLFLVMEFAEGPNLQSRVRSLGRLPLKEVLRLGAEVGQILQAAHRLGVVHRGLTPRNILFVPTSDGQGEQIRILDFGVAHLPPMADLLDHLLPYQAPELVYGEEPDARADQYALAAILFEALSGRPPPMIDEIELLDDSVAAPTLDLLCPEVPLHVRRAIERGLSPMRGDRFSSMIDFTRALDDRGLDPFRSATSAQLSQRSRPASLRSPMAPSARSQAGAESQRSQSLHSLSPVALQPAPSNRATLRGGRRHVPSILVLCAACAVAFYLGATTRTVATLGAGVVATPARSAFQPAPEPAPAPEPDPVKEAEQALARGESARAIELARLAVPSAAAWRIIAISACRLADQRLLGEALQQLSDADRASVEAGCRAAAAASLP